MLLTTQTHYFTTEPSHLIVASLAFLTLLIAIYFDYLNNSESDKKEKRIQRDLQERNL